MLIEAELTSKILGAALEVHKVLGPGLLESAYEESLCHELGLRALRFERQVDLPVANKSVTLSCGYRLDVVVQDVAALQQGIVRRVL